MKRWRAQEESPQRDFYETFTELSLLLFLRESLALNKYLIGMFVFWGGNAFAFLEESYLLEIESPSEYSA